MEILQKRRAQILLLTVGVIALSITAEKFRLLVGEEAASKSAQFTVLNCLDGSSGTLACVVKEGVKLYFYNIRSLHVETRRNKAIEAALADAVSQGMTAKDAAKLAQTEGAKAAKLATKKAKRIIGPIISSGWDFFEALYFGGTVTEGFLRGTGTLFGTYYVGFLGEERFGRFGYLVGSHLGSWIGGRIGLMVYDVVNGIYYLMVETRVYESASPDRENFPGDENVEKSDDVAEEDSDVTVSKATSFDESNSFEIPADESSESTWSSNSVDSGSYGIPAGESFDAHDEF
ncbi:hypothetical protein ABFS82_02G092000 [Erythranthe guttata]|uniref:Uncharacterized protein n=1 Tax=Erythranthe guttata TaxID=4155 RepID=A0A022RBX7_ERYGU|nr:PREDICTED: uncharacterized protein LOC105958226 [Erythranthe guttata]EYU37233.1 hypothetical protein MIMGU_mgv1a011224mg [Erythranthe guttata]|eukprot:XP_012837680.1 PREDICTED: uncharacterized protein LOC105958226 [Erythranthe guttata]